ncbi:AraC family transcriptional regulator with amidase-like domain [Tamaricihabitans halophyticus]|uniref:AraC family transcriptional regulator with amidase-like domain n=1 Tax=Tamaricihabitans halophyticus TaxID=1262583 RepID=A0A4R2R3Z3_9PSEU|nr:helix-turn-helix domain-containing protein [Tamaricihabitans halophyticus]TCP56449.1 AraC family transcriptional regulator with amidase-like domain [Tamaricihabitans halophyticus]
MTIWRHPGRHRVAVYLRHGVVPLELGIAHQLFGGARDDSGALLYEVVTCAHQAGQQVRTDADFPVTVAHGRQAFDEADTVLIPATHEEGPPELGGTLDRELRMAFDRIRPGTRIASICTGAFVLAAAGLLDGHTATTHWLSAEQFRRLYPNVRLDPDVLYTDGGNVLTSAGEAAGIDLCLHMIRRDFGATVANELAKRVVVPAHRAGGQAQYIAHPVRGIRESSTGRAREWALTQLGRTLSLTELAARESMSVRTFTRRFRDEVGISPIQWLTQQRIERARQLLEQTDLPIDRIAEDVGFGTAVSLRQHLRATLGVSPSAYRSTFRSTTSSGSVR